MKWAGSWMVVFGLLNFALRYVGYDLTWFEVLGAKRDPVAVALLVVGVAMLLIGWRRGRAAR